MPVVEIRALPHKRPSDVPFALERVCTELAAAMGIPEKQVWATWQTIDARRYVEGRDPMPHQPPDTHPPLVRLQAFEGRSPEMIRTMLETVAKSLESSLGLGEGNVMVVYEELKSGRVWAGGGILE